jgi:alpha-1,2-mannosyltransferase
MPHTLFATIRRSPLPSALGVVACLALTWPLARRFLIEREPWQTLVDLEVYREAGLSVLIGRPVYEYLTPTPQLLPFTYPPISAVLSVPLTWLPLRPLGWVWTLSQIVMLAGIVAVAFRPLVARFGSFGPLAVGLLTGGLFWLLPFRDGIMFGQVDVLLVALCFADYAARRPRWPRGMLIGAATAIKLTPGVFIVHLWLAGKRREAATATATAVGLTLAAFVIIPGDSADFWFRALFDPERLGNNAGTSNQSIRGALLRFGPESGLLWLAIAGVVGFFGFRSAVRLSRAGNDLAAAAVVGLLAVLLSPVAWIHHLAWVVLSLAVLAGNGRDPRRLLLAAAVAVFFYFAIPWTGAAMTESTWHPNPPIVLARIIQDSFGLVALLLLPVVTRYGLRDAAAAKPPPAEHGAGRGPQDRDRSPAGALVVTEAVRP